MEQLKCIKLVMGLFRREKHYYRSISPKLQTRRKINHLFIDKSDAINGKYSLMKIINVRELCVWLRMPEAPGSGPASLIMPSLLTQGFACESPFYELSRLHLCRAFKNVLTDKIKQAGSLKERKSCLGPDSTSTLEVSMRFV